MKKSEGSYTVELALLLPVLLLSLFAPVYMGYDMYMQTKEASVFVWEETERAEERVLKIKFAKEVLEEWK
jgi:hypothetical protein